MKKIKPWILIGIVLLSILFYYCNIYLGTPWEKAHSIKTAKDYLKEKYTQEMTVGDTMYDACMGTYYVKTCTIETPPIYFNVAIDRKNGEVWYDDYYLRYFENEMDKSLSEYAQKLFGKDVRVKDRIDSNNINVYHIENLNESTKLEEVIDKFDTKYQLFLSISGEFNNTQDEIEKLYNFITFIKSLESKPYYIHISYYKDNSDNSNFSLSLTDEDIEFYSCIEDIIPDINEEFDEIEPYNNADFQIKDDNNFIDLLGEYDKLVTSEKLIELKEPDETNKDYVYTYANFKIITDGDVIKSIELTTPVLSTNRGINIGDKIGDVQKKYGNSCRDKRKYDKENGILGQYEYYRSEQTITFFIDEEGTVVSIRIVAL